MQQLTLFDLAEPELATAPIIEKPPASIAWVPIKWSLVELVHLSKPGTMTPICGCPGGAPGEYSATGEAFGWQTTIRGRVSTCKECVDLTEAVDRGELGVSTDRRMVIGGDRIAHLLPMDSDTAKCGARPIFTGRKWRDDPGVEYSCKRCEL